MFSRLSAENENTDDTGLTWGGVEGLTRLGRDRQKKKISLR